MTKMIHQGLKPPRYIYQQNEFIQSCGPSQSIPLKRGQLLLSDCYHYHNEMHVRMHVNDSIIYPFSSLRTIR